MSATKRCIKCVASVARCIFRSLPRGVAALHQMRCIGAPPRTWCPDDATCNAPAAERCICPWHLMQRLGVEP